MANTEIRIRIILNDPPPGVLFGLQQGSGPGYQTVQLQRSGIDDLIFELPIQIKSKKAGDLMPDFAGPFVQGPKSERFIYIDIGTAAGDYTSEWTRRLKIPLKDITDNTIETVVKNSGILQTKVPGRAKDGGPNCATVKPFSGWTVTKT